MMYAVKICLRVIIVAFFAVQCDTVDAMKGKMLNSDLPLKKRKIKQPIVEDQETLLTVSDPVDEKEEESFDGDFVCDIESESSSSDDDSSYEPEEDESVIEGASYRRTCSTCRLTFNDPSSFYLHLKAKHIHLKKTKGKKRRLYYCDMCNKYIVNLCNHLYTHHVKFRRFVCSWCGNSFFQSGGLSAHKKCCANR